MHLPRVCFAAIGNSLGSSHPSSYKIISIGPMLVRVDTSLLGVASVVNKNKVHTLDVLMEVTNICVSNLLLDLCTTCMISQTRLRVYCARGDVNIAKCVLHRHLPQCPLAPRMACILAIQPSHGGRGKLERWARSCRHHPSLRS